MVEPEWASLVAQLVKKSSCDAGDLDSILGWEDPLEEGTATHSSILQASLLAQIIKNLPAMQAMQV